MSNGRQCFIQGDRKLVLRRKVIIDAHYGEIRLRGQNTHDSVVGIEVAHDKTATMEVDQTRQCLFLSRQIATKRNVSDWSLDPAFLDRGDRRRISVPVGALLDI